MQSNDFFKKLITHIPEAIGTPIIITDGKGRILFANSSCQEIIGSSMKTISQAMIDDIFEGIDDLARFIKEALSGKRILAFDCSLRNRGGEQIYLDYVEINRLTPLDDENLHLVVTFREKEKSFVEKIGEREEQIKSPYDIVWRGIAHEVKNPLSGIKGAAQMLLRSMEDSSPFLDHARVILRETDRINRFLDSLWENRGLNLAGSVDMFKVLNEAIELTRSFVIAKGKNISIKFSADTSLPNIDGDGDALFRVFTNILKNAVEAIEGEGEIRIGVKLHEDLVLKSKKGEKNYMLVIDFFDNGISIGEEDEPFLFLPFFTNKPAGSGMGLFTVQNTIAAHGGTVKVKRYKDGKSFKLYLPTGKE